MSTPDPTDPGLLGKPAGWPPASIDDPVSELGMILIRFMDQVLAKNSGKLRWSVIMGAVNVFAEEYRARFIETRLRQSVKKPTSPP